MQVDVLQKISLLRRGPHHPPKFLTERIHPRQSHFTGYSHEMLYLMSSDLISLQLLHFWSLPQMQALEKITKRKS